MVDQTTTTTTIGFPLTWNRHFILILVAAVLELIILLAYVVPFALPRPEAWQAGAFLAFFASFL